MSSAEGGAASAAPSRRLWRDEAVLAWVAKQRRAGRTRDEIAADSKAGRRDWPYEGHHLPQNGVDIAIAILADRGDRPAPKRPPRVSGRRLRQIHEQKRDQGPSGLLDMRERMMKVVGALEWIEMPDVGLSEIESDAIAMIFDDLTILSRWTEAALDAVVANMDDLQRQRKIQALHARAADPSSTPNERESAARLAVVLEEKRNAARIERGTA